MNKYICRWWCSMSSHSNNTRVRLWFQVEWCWAHCIPRIHIYFSGKIAFWHIKWLCNIGFPDKYLMHFVYSILQKRKKTEVNNEDKIFKHCCSTSLLNVELYASPQKKNWASVNGKEKVFINKIYMNMQFEYACVLMRPFGWETWREKINV